MVEPSRANVMFYKISVLLLFFVVQIASQEPISLPGSDLDKYKNKKAKHIITPYLINKLG
jgi:hypothetical protein